MKAYFYSLLRFQDAAALKVKNSGLRLPKEAYDFLPYMVETTRRMSDIFRGLKQPHVFFIRRSSAEQKNLFRARYQTLG